MPSQLNPVQITEEALGALRMFGMMAAGVSDADIDAALKNLEMVHTLGPMMDPTKYREAMWDGRLDRQRDVLRLFKKTKAELKRIFPEGWPE